MAISGTDLLEQFLVYEQVEKGLSSNTIIGYNQDLTQFLKFSKNNFSKEYIEDWILSLKNLAPTTLSRKLTSLKEFLLFAWEENYINKDLTDLIIMPKLPKHLPEVLTIDEVTKLLEDSKKDITPKGIRDWCLLEFLYSTGARVSEIVGISSSDIQYEKGDKVGLLRLKGKGSKVRFVPLSIHSLFAYSQYLEKSRPELLGKNKSQVIPANLFLNLRGKPLSRQSIWEIIQTAAKRSEIKKHLYPHIFRHTCATHLIQGGADIRFIQEMLGHASATTTQIYTHISNQQIREVFASSHPRALL
jgi:integrase/recombinase XerD